jgi:hypothetical protein
LLSVLAAAAATAVVLGFGWGSMTNASNEQAKTQMDLVIDGTSADCNSATDEKCTLGEDEAFTVRIVPSAIPEGGYIGWQTNLDYGSLQYNMTPTAAAEIKFPAGVLPLRSAIPPRVSHGNVTGLIPPYTPTMQKTALVNLSFTCTTSSTLELLEYDEVTQPDGNTYSDPNAVVIGPNVGVIDINCGSGPPTDTPTTGPTLTPTEVTPSATPSITLTPTPVTPSATPTQVTPSPTSEKICGGVDEDEAVNSVDALFVLWEVADLASPPNPDSADVDGDGDIDAIDAALILQFEADLIDSLDC